jgi:hypothetical protein
VPILFRKSKTFGPVRLNVSKTGVSVTWYPLWPLTRAWSWNSRQRRQRVDLPGPFSWQSRARRKGARRLSGLDRAVVTLMVLAGVAGLGWWGVAWVLGRLGT